MQAGADREALVSSCNRTPLPKAKTRVRAGNSKPVLHADDDGLGKAYQVPKVVVDWEEMSAPTIEQVIVRVYDMGPRYLAHWHAHGKNYNTFHSSVEVFGHEYSYDMRLDTGPSHVNCIDPGGNSTHELRAVLPMGYSSCSPRDALQLIEDMTKEWKRSTYNVRTWNCHHFTDALCERLGVKRLPDWVTEVPADAGSKKVERVFISVYDLGQTWVTRWHNAMVKSYGAFHSGVVVYGREWSFGMTESVTSTGVGWCQPMKCPDHSFRETLSMGCTSCSPEEFSQIISEMMVEWQGCSYDVFKRNCHNFSSSLCERLGVGPMPVWVNTLASSLAPRDDEDEVEDTGH